MNEELFKELNDLWYKYNLDDRLKEYKEGGKPLDDNDCMDLQFILTLKRNLYI